MNIQGMKVKLSGQIDNSGHPDMEGDIIYPSAFKFPKGGVPLTIKFNQREVVGMIFLGNPVVDSKGEVYANIILDDNTNINYEIVRRIINGNVDPINLSLGFSVESSDIIQDGEVKNILKIDKVVSAAIYPHSLGSTLKTEVVKLQKQTFFGKFKLDKTKRKR